MPQSYTQFYTQKTKNHLYFVVNLVTVIKCTDKRKTQLNSFLIKLLSEYI
jgi:hypothetical protein